MRLLKGHRARDSESLDVIATQLCQKRMLPNGFNALGQRFDVQPFCHCQDRCNHSLLVRIAIRFHDK